MRIKVSNATALVAVLQAGIKTAEANGEADFELTGALQAFDDTARQELQDAINEASK